MGDTVKLIIVWPEYESNIWICDSLKEALKLIKDNTASGPPELIAITEIS